MDKTPAYGAGDSGFESQYGLVFFPHRLACVEIRRKENHLIFYNHRQFVTQHSGSLTDSFDATSQGLHPQAFC